MEYEVTVKMRLESRCGAERVKSLVQAVFDFGTVREAIAEGVQLRENPHCVRVAVCRAEYDVGPSTEHVVRR